MKYYDKGIFTDGTRADQRGRNREEDVVNEINGTETDCILSVLTSPYQESLYAENQARFKCKTSGSDVELCLKKVIGERKLSKRLSRFLLKKRFHLLVGKQQKKIRLDKSGKMSIYGICEQCIDPASLGVQP